MPASKPSIAASRSHPYPTARGWFGTPARAIAVLAIVVPSLFWFSAAPAVAVVACAFDPVTATAAITFGPGAGFSYPPWVVEVPNPVVPPVP